MVSALMYQVSHGTPSTSAESATSESREHARELKVGGWGASQGASSPLLGWGGRRWDFLPLQPPTSFKPSMHDELVLSVRQEAGPHHPRGPAWLQGSVFTDHSHVFLKPFIYNPSTSAKHSSGRD